MRHYFGIFVAVLLLGVPWFALTYPNEMRTALSAIGAAGSQIAAVVLSHKPKTVADIQLKYTASQDMKSDKKVRILIVPGHEPGYGGAEFGSLKERDLNVELGKDLQQFLQANDHYQVFITRDREDWNSIFAAYFKNNWEDIITWVKAYHREMSYLVSVGSVKKSAPTVIHNTAPTDVAYRLYGITKWANEDDIDIIIHVHFNDDSVRSRGVAGDYSGFAIYVPENQYDNSTTTLAVASNVFKRLAKFNPVSDLPGESTGIVKEPDLIAIGANNTSDAASMLIEYGYIYEPQLINPELRSAALKDMAFQTYLGLQDFFDAKNVVNSAVAYDTLLIPHQWKNVLTKNSTSSPDVYDLQTALVIDGVYPPSKKSLNDCPRTGSLGPCTATAIEAFQKKYGITDEKGIVGTKTRGVLNDRFGSNRII
jgi:N-acetylmuramoyl-L-alanine amidase